MKVFTQRSNPLTGTVEWDVQDDDYDFHQEIARSAFADMLHDTERNQKYYQGLKMAIDKVHREGKKANVLDIGTGTGLLSIMAAQCGADTITACEAFQPMAECALKILQHNAVAHKIQLIPKRSTDITVGDNGDMKQKANILVTEVFDTELIGEGALGTFSHAHKYLLEKDCVVVPDSAVLYVQIVECPTMQKWNKLNDLADEDLRVILRTPKKMKACAGSAAVHDIQLSQLPRDSFRPLSEAIPVLHYDWSGRTPIDKSKVAKQQIEIIDTGVAQMVFMWWDLNMDTEGKVLLSCAPWWCHPDADKTSKRPENSIPWRDHWMQAVYYFPQELTTQTHSHVTLTSCHDEYSLWFYLEDEKLRYEDYKRPICECGVHMILSRTHVSYLNDGKRSKKYLTALQETINENSVVLSVHGASLLGLAAAKMGAKKAYYVENNKFVLDVIKSYIVENDITNVVLLSEIDETKLEEVTHVIGDPCFASSILPWDNLRLAHLLFKYGNSLRDGMDILPSSCELWAVPVEFLHLQKIRIPLGVCEGVDLTVFDKLVEDSRQISDEELEAQPLWEYPCICRGTPRKIFSLDMHNLKVDYCEEGVFSLCEINESESQRVNGFAVWSVWGAGSTRVSAGALGAPAQGELMHWDMHTKQAVKILEKSHVIRKSDKWSYTLKCDLNKGCFGFKININDLH